MFNPITELTRVFAFAMGIPTGCFASLAVKHMLYCLPKSPLLVGPTAAGALAASILLVYEIGKKEHAVYRNPDKDMPERELCKRTFEASYSAIYYPPLLVVSGGVSTIMKRATEELDDCGVAYSFWTLTGLLFGGSVVINWFLGLQLRALLAVPPSLSVINMAGCWVVMFLLIMFQVLVIFVLNAIVRPDKVATGVLKNPLRLMGRK